MKSTVLAIVGIISCFATFVVANWISPIASALSTHVIEMLFLMLAAGVWLSKARIKIAYALWEFQVGMFALAVAAQRAPFTDSQDPDQRNLLFISLMGGIFLIVRGIDDLIETVPAAMRTLKKWGL